MNLDQYKSWLKLNTDSSKTVKTYLSVIHDYFNSFTEFNQENINNYLGKKLENNIQNTTFNKIIFAFKKYCQFLKIELEFPKIKRVDKKIKQYITEEEFKDKILSITSLIWDDYEFKDLILKTLFYTGIRPEELCNIELSDINFEKRTILIRETKGKKDRLIFSINDSLFEELKKYSEVNKESKFFGLNYQTLYYFINRLKKELYDKYPLSPKFFRISFAKHCLSKGMDISNIKKLLGHADLSTTDLYAEPDNDMVNKACDNFKLNNSSNNLLNIKNIIYNFNKKELKELNKWIRIVLKEKK